MKKRMSFILALLTMIMNTCSFAGEPMQTRSEIAYVNLDEYGNIEQINVYNKYCNVSENGIVDYGNYSELTNLTNYDVPIKEENHTKWEIGSLDKFSYMGKLSREAAINIPWSIDISYKLNGEDKKAEELLGQKGLVKITIDIKENEYANEFFKNNFMLEITSSFDMSDYISVSSKDAIEVLTGNTKTLMLIALPGQNKTFEIEVGSDNFSMDGITFAMVQIQGEVLDDVADVNKDKKEIEDALDSLNTSMDVLLNNMANMNSGNQKLINGTKDIKTASNKLHEFAATRNQNIEDLSDDLMELNRITINAVNDIENLQEAINDINKMAGDVDEKLPKLINNLDDVSDVLDNFEDFVDDVPDNLKDIEKLISDTRNTIKSTGVVLKAKAGGQDFDTSEIEKSMKSLGALAAEYGAKAQQAESMEQAAEYAEIATTIKASLETLVSEMEQIEGNVSSGQSSAKNLISNLNKVEKDLELIEDTVHSLTKDAKNLPDDINSMQKSVDSINDILKIAKENLDNYLNKKDDIDNAIVHLNEFATEMQEINNHVTNVLSHVQTVIKILDNELYNGGTEIADGITELLNRTQNIANESSKIKKSKNTVYNIAKDRLKDVSEKTNLFEIEKNTKKVSFVSSENEEPESVQILLKSKDIKSINFEMDNDLEPKKEKTSIWDKIMNVFRIIGNWFKEKFVKEINIILHIDIK